MPATPSPDARAIDDHIRNRLALARERRGWSSAELARRLGWSRQKLAPYEKDSAIPAALLIRLAQALQVEMGFFFEDLLAPAPGVAEAQAGEPAPTDQAVRVAAILRRTPARHHGAILRVVRALAEELDAGEGAGEEEG